MNWFLWIMMSVSFIASGDETDRCYFEGSVFWDEADYAVVWLSHRNGVFQDSIHLAEPGDYNFGEYSAYTVDGNEPWRVDCWLMMHGQQVPTPKYRALIYWPDDFVIKNYVWYCTTDFSW